jgi:predicted Zn-dependent protease
VTADRIAEVQDRVQQTPFHLVPDILDFQLVRAKLLVMGKTPQEGIAFFSDALGDKRFGNQIAQRYGLVLALLRAHKYSDGAREFAILIKQAPANAMLETLHGKIRLAAGQDKNIGEFYRKATQTFPQHRELVYDYASILLDEKHYNEVLKLLNAQIIEHGNDATLYDLQARAFAALGRLQEEHHALAYNYLLHGNLRGGIDQLELAKRSGNDYYELSTIESELKQFREIAEAQKKKQ